MVTAESPPDLPPSSTLQLFQVQSTQLPSFQRRNPGAGVTALLAVSFKLLLGDSTLAYTHTTVISGINLQVSFLRQFHKFTIYPPPSLRAKITGVRQ